MNIFKHQVVITEKRTKLISELYDIFGNDLFNQEKYHKITKPEIKQIYDVINSVIFDNKLPSDMFFDLSLNIEDGKGYADICELTEDNTLVIKNTFTIFYCPEDDDILLEIIDTIGHEMIHIYDVMYGPMKNYINKIVKTTEKRQLDIEYDTHGYFLMNLLKNFINKEFI